VGGGLRGFRTRSRDPVRQANEKRAASFPEGSLRRIVFGGTRKEDSMPGTSTDIPNALDTATASCRQARRVRNQRIRTRIALGLSGCIALFALAAYLIGDYAAARFCATTACVLFAFVYIAGAAAREKAVDALRETNRS
jgi:hypothetical protein